MEEKNYMLTYASCCHIMIKIQKIEVYAEVIVADGSIFRVHV